MRPRRGRTEKARGATRNEAARAPTGSEPLRLRERKRAALKELTSSCDTPRDQREREWQKLLASLVGLRSLWLRGKLVIAFLHKLPRAVASGEQKDLSLELEEDCGNNCGKVVDNLWISGNQGKKRVVFRRKSGKQFLCDLLPPHVMVNSLSLSTSGRGSPWPLPGCTGCKTDKHRSVLQIEVE